MYPVSLEYKNKIKENNRIFECKIQIEHSAGTLNLTDKDLVLGSLIYSEGSQSGEEFTVGGTVASDIKFTILNKSEYDNINFTGARVFANIGLMVQEGADAHFLQPSQPSKMPGFEEKWEYVPLGRFNIDDVKRLRNTIELKAIDDMINLDIPYSLSKLSYPATLYQIYVNICNVADVQVGTVSFPNMGYVVQERPNEDLTLRDVLGYVAELSGTFAKFNRNGGLELKWYQPTDLVLGPKNRFNFKPSDDVVQIKGVMATVGDTTYLAGSEDYAIDLTDNPLLQGGYETVLPNIFNNIKDTIFTPYISDWQGNPAIQAGDLITQIDIDGKEYNTLVTKSVYKYRGRSILEAKGLPDISKGFKGSTSRRIAQIKRVVEKEVGDKLTTLEQAQLNANELMASMLGGHFIEDKENGILYITDNPSLENSTKIWKWGAGGFGYSEDGGTNWKTAITADGSIVAMLISAGIITADMIKTGILISEDGSSWVNMDNGEFNLKDKVKYVNNKFSLEVTTSDIKDVDKITPHNIILDNENQSIITDSTGKVTTGTIVTSAITTLKGASRISGTIGTLTLKDSNGNTITATGIALTKGNPTSASDGYVTMTINSGVNIPSDSGYIEIPITMDGMGYVKKLTWTKAKAGTPGKDGLPGTPGKDGIDGQDGIDGKNARVVSIAPSHSYFVSNTISIHLGDYIYIPTTITLTPTFQNCTYHKWFYSINGTDWNEVISGSNGLTINSTTKALSISRASDLYSTSNSSVIFKVTSSDNDYDLITIPRIYDSTTLSNTVALKTTDDAIIGAVERKIGGDVTELALKSEVKQTAHAWTAKFDNLMNLKIRYIRDWQNGSVGYPNNSYWNELLVIDKNGVNIFQSSPNAGAITQGDENGAITSIANPRNWTDNNATTYASSSTNGWKYLQWDLGAATSLIRQIGIKHYGVGRKYNHRLEVSEDGNIWYSLYDSEFDGYYSEASTPRMYDINQIKSGITTINGEGIKVEHGSSNQYSMVKVDGILRQWLYGESYYLNDIHIAQYTREELRTADLNTVIDYTPMSIPLPQRFRGRSKQNVKAFLVPVDLFFWGSSFTSNGTLNYYNGYSTIILDVKEYHLDVPEPYLDIDAIQYARMHTPGQPTEYEISAMTFLVIVISY